ncbi:hypothetical protein FO519_010156 [Halicephalobus sp. NKZ332]|nr:hypothetical protein FO519_010156 [Halicephalobus sp. NKZ332]
MITAVLFWRKCYKALKAFMFLICVRTVLDFGYLIYAIVAASIAASIKTDPEKKEKITEEELGQLFVSIFVILDLFANLLALKAAFIEYKYLKGRVENGLV